MVGVGITSTESLGYVNRQLNLLAFSILKTKKLQQYLSSLHRAIK